MDSSGCFYLRLVDLLILIFTFSCENLTLVFIVTCLILGSSAFLFFTHSNHNLPVSLDQNDPNQMSNVVTKDCLNMGSLGSCSESKLIDPFSCTIEEHSDFDEFPCRIPNGYISDEESLIEIELSSGKVIRHNVMVAGDE
ncbi:hypothetical protein QVD17_27285 [Tagetes erecta]|uniref:Uncharacterized protein n=1 Tax=Tagetes erecta TaxID=13708 RepID=A0AAD8KAY1_TARER|nr:hypothetical protein QVD17_27285 [Tagetes erecta]